MEFEEKNGTVADNILAPFQPVAPFFAGSAHGATPDQVFIRDRFSANKTALEIGVDDSSGFGGGVGGMDGPSVCFFIGKRKEGPYVKGVRRMQYPGPNLRIC